MKQIGRGKKDQPVDTQQRFSLGDGVLVAVLGNDVGVGIITDLWEQRIEGGEGGGEQEDSMVKLCEVRWCYRKQDLPTTMNSLKIADVSTKFIGANGRLIIPL